MSGTLILKTSYHSRKFPITKDTQANMEKPTIPQKKIGNAAWSDAAKSYFGKIILIQKSGCENNNRGHKNNSLPFH